MQVQLDFVVLASAFSSIGGFLWLLRYESYSSLKHIQDYKTKHEKKFQKFLIKFNKKEDEQSMKLFGHKTASISVPEQIFFENHRSLQRRIAISIVIISSTLQVIQGILPCLWCYVPKIISSL